MNDDERAALRKQMTRLHRRAQKAEAALAREQAKYKRLCERIRKPGNYAGILRPMIQSLSIALGIRGIRRMYGMNGHTTEARQNNVIMQVLDSIRTIDAANYEHWHDLIRHAPVPEKPKRGSR